MKKNEKLTIEQQQLVIENQHLVDIVIRRYVIINKENPGYSHDDLFQVGCLGLCIAAQKYDPARGDFGSFAMYLIWQQILVYLQSINRHQAVRPIEDDEDNGGPDRFVDTRAEFDPQQATENQEFVTLLKDLEKNYTGVTLKGIQALELMLVGYKGTDIADLYKVQPNHVSAWIARARKKLRQDERLLQYLK